MIISIHVIFFLHVSDDYLEDERIMHSRNKRQTKTKYVVEVLVVVDYSVYER